MPTATVHPVKTPALILYAALLAGSLPAWAQDSAASAGNARPATEQVIVPQVDRRPVQRPQYPSRDFSVGLYGGT